jgi:UDP-glucose:tetrahydrobiopterin glucosyltransferase
MLRRIVFISTPVSSVGSGDGGGADTTLLQVTAALAARGHSVAVIAPTGSVVGTNIRLYPVSGSRPPSATAVDRDSQAAVGGDCVLVGMREQARKIQHDCDVVIAMSYDKLSYDLTPRFSVPVLHWVTLPSTSAAVDRAISACYAIHPDWFCFYSRAQAATFPFIDSAAANIIPGAVDTQCFQFRADPDPVLAWVARISPEKGLEDAVKVAEMAGMPLNVCGKIQDHDYWQYVRQCDAGRKIIYHGMLPHDRLRELLGRASASLVTPKWIEAFGLTVVEALACGTPVVAYAQGGPGEIVEDGRSGFLTPQDDVAAMTRAVEKISTIRRSDARLRAENYSVGRMAERVEAWIESILG